MAARVTSTRVTMIVKLPGCVVGCAVGCATEEPTNNAKIKTAIDRIIGYHVRVKLKVLPTTQPWYADGLQFSCTQCGNCCTGGPGYVWISNVEIERLAQHLNISKKDVMSRYCRRIGKR